MQSHTNVSPFSNVSCLGSAAALIGGSHEKRRGDARSIRYNTVIISIRYPFIGRIGTAHGLDVAPTQPFQSNSRSSIWGDVTGFPRCKGLVTSPQGGWIPLLSPTVQASDARQHGGPATTATKASSPWQRNPPTPLLLSPLFGDVARGFVAVSATSPEVGIFLQSKNCIAYHSMHAVIGDAVSGACHLTTSE